MARTKKEPVSFKVFEEMLDKVKESMQNFDSGETMSKYRANKLLAAYRKNLSELGKLIPGARLHSVLAQRDLVAKKDVVILPEGVPDIPPDTETNE